MAQKRTRAAVKLEDNELARTSSHDSLRPKGLLRNGSFTSLFRKRTRRSLHGDNDGNSTDNNRDGTSDTETGQIVKKQKTSSKQEEEFLKREKELDLLLPEEYRKYRPRGFPFNLPPKNRAIRIYADGVFDLFHLGHMRQLEQCKKAFPNVELVCGIPSDVETHKRKGLTVLTDEQRYETLKHCRWVDQVIPDAPWCVDLAFLKKHKIDYVAHDDLPYVSDESDDIYKPMKEAGMFLATQRTEGISTSDIITKIIRDYDKYLMRNFARGATRKELNVSWLKKNELDLKKQVNDFRKYFKQANQNVNNASKDLYFEVREYLRGKNLKRQKTSSLASSVLSREDSSFERASSPASDFASRYIGNKSLGIHHNRSFIDNFKDWMKKGGDLELESTSSSPSASNYDDDEDSTGSEKETTKKNQDYESDLSDE